MMLGFKLPTSSIVNRVIPKNAFDSYATNKQKSEFTSSILRITWLFKLSTQSINLPSEGMQEIQIIKVELKEKSDIKSLLDVIDKAIPYPIIFQIEFKNESYFSASSKHLHPINPDNAVLDWNFKSEWLTDYSKYLSLDLKISIDHIFKTYCERLSGKEDKIQRTISELVLYEQEKSKLLKEIQALKSKISSTKQFNKKVELNIKLQELELKKTQHFD